MMYNYKPYMGSDMMWPTGKLQETVTRGLKIGRNDLCPCGSGLKYKKCCLGKEKPAPLSEEIKEKIYEEVSNQMIECIRKGEDEGQGEILDT